MTSWKQAVHVLVLLLGVIAVFNGAEAGGSKGTHLNIRPPRLRDYIKIRNDIIEKPDKRKRLRTEVIAGANKFVVKVPNPPIVLHHVLDYWPYHRVYKTSFLGIINYIHKILWLGYKVLWILFDMVLILVRILLQVGTIGNLRHSYDELSKPSPWNYHEDDY
ncbi:unnamed protein product [Orchesella dallaii]|uniref:Uncharacterized protein n=1 Tax=Orchesella dallaii TaxID=48710 RepID=A0ABP1RG08_9HEXA